MNNLTVMFVLLFPLRSSHHSLSCALSSCASRMLCCSCLYSMHTVYTVVHTISKHLMCNCTILWKNVHRTELKIYIEAAVLLSGENLVIWRVDFFELARSPDSRQIWLFVLSFGTHRSHILARSGGLASFGTALRPSEQWQAWRKHKGKAWSAPTVS